MIPLFEPASEAFEVELNAKRMRLVGKAGT